MIFGQYMLGYHRRDLQGHYIPLMYNASLALTLKYLGVIITVPTTGAMTTEFDDDFDF